VRSKKRRGRRGMKEKRERKEKQAVEKKTHHVTKGRG